MTAASPLPTYLVKRYHGWKATTFEETRSRFRNLVDDGQHPRAMVISCCDSRVHTTEMFGADVGEIFLHRNIAALVPPADGGGDRPGTAAAIEYAVTVLKVSHLVVVTHSQCGGVAGCFDMCSGHAPQLEGGQSFVGSWLEILRPGFDRLSASERAEALPELERGAAVLSLENLMTYDFVRSAVEAGDLTLHGLWTDIASGTVEQLDAESGTFETV